MTELFAKYPIIGYDLIGDGEKQAAVNILQRARIREILLSQYMVFYEYAVKDGERPEHIAHKLYGSSKFHWLVLYANSIVNPYFDWPMYYDDLIASIRKTYTTLQREGLEYAYTTLHHYEDVYGNVIDFTSFTLLPVEERSQVMVYDWEVGENEKKRTIRLLDKRMVDQIDAEMTKIMIKRLV